MIHYILIIFQSGVTNTSDNTEEINNNIDQEVILEIVSKMI